MSLGAVAGAVVRHCSACTKRRSAQPSEWRSLVNSPPVRLLPTAAASPLLRRHRQRLVEQRHDHARISLSLSGNHVAVTQRLSGCCTAAQRIACRCLTTDSAGMKCGSHDGHRLEGAVPGIVGLPHSPRHGGDPHGASADADTDLSATASVPMPAGLREGVHVRKRLHDLRVCAAGNANPDTHTHRA